MNSNEIIVNENKYQKGSVLVNFGRLYEVYKIGEKLVDKQKQKIIFYKRLYSKESRDSIVFSIPVENIEKTRIRKPLSEKAVMKLLKSLETRVELIDPVKMNKRNFLIDALDERIETIKQLWLEKNNDNKVFPYSKKKLFEKLIDSIKEEVAYVLEINLKNAEEKILSSLNIMVINK